MILTTAESHRDLKICPLTFLVFVVRPLYSETPDTPSNAATALISEIRCNIFSTEKFEEITTLMSRFGKLLYIFSKKCLTVVSNDPHYVNIFRGVARFSHWRNPV